MIQSTFNNPTPQFHVAIIMDGNGRWAAARRLSRSDGHEAGCQTVKRIVECAPDLGITTLTLYAFSSDNWKRPKAEVNKIMKLLKEYLSSETPNCVNNDIRLSMIGRRDRLSPSLRTAIRCSERATADNKMLHLRFAVDYSSKDSILRAATLLNTSVDKSRETFERILSDIHHTGTGNPDVDLLIRTGGEQRLSDFLLWESAYAELYFTETQWPDFSEDDLERAIEEYQHRTRRFGAVLA